MKNEQHFGTARGVGAGRWVGQSQGSSYFQDQLENRSSCDRFLPGVAVANSALANKAAEVRANRINWQSYLQSKDNPQRNNKYHKNLELFLGQMINQEQYNVIMMLDTSPPPRRDQFLREHKYECARTFLEMVANVAKDQTVQYLLTMIDDILQV